jgi:hypothetical protein
MEVEGVEDFERFAKQLQVAAKEFPKETSQAIFRATKPIKVDLKQSLASNLPQRGGLAKRAAKTKLMTRRRTTGKAAGVRIVGKGTLSLYHLDKGQVRHRKPAVNEAGEPGDIDGGKVQSITPGVWTKPAEASAPMVRQEIVKAMDGVAKKAVRGL